jgi:hypothetical protein
MLVPARGRNFGSVVRIFRSSSSAQGGTIEKDFRLNRTRTAHARELDRTRTTGDATALRVLCSVRRSGLTSTRWGGALAS